jgi:Zn-finger nucleic acid-binding protein
MSEDSMKCPGCGGDARPESVTCEWCGVFLAKVSCPACFGSMFAGMKHCPWCGAKPSREDAVDISAASCPRCSVKMFAVKVGKTGVGECRKCGGLWVDAESFEQICRDREDQEQILGPAAPVKDRPKIETPPGRMYVPCPVCAKLMNRINFGNCSGVIIDWCKDHGSWFDKDELSHIVAFIQKGGLKKSRAREQERLKKAPAHIPALTWREDQPSFLDFLSATWKSLSQDG